MKKYQSLGRSLSRNEMKNVLGGVETNCITCSGQGFGSETYCGTDMTLRQAERKAALSIAMGVADGSCPPEVGPVTCA